MCTIFRRCVFAYCAVYLYLAWIHEEIDPAPQVCNLSKYTFIGIQLLTIDARRMIDAMISIFFQTGLDKIKKMCYTCF